jgi:hypothetical protein
MDALGGMDEREVDRTAIDGGIDRINAGSTPSENVVVLVVVLFAVAIVVVLVDVLVLVVVYNDEQKSRQISR